MMDRLSDLPDGIVHEIFSCLPTEQIVRTSVLSKRWNGLWLSSLVLSFDKDLQLRRIDNFTEYINQTLIFRGSSKVVSFRINIILNHDYTQHLDLWIRYALQNEAEEFMLDLERYHGFYIPPQFFYFSSSLTSLSLSQCRIRLTRGASWTSLKTLVLKLVILEVDAGHQLLLGCPQLESLELVRCLGYHVLKIYSTSLKRLVIEDYRIRFEYISKEDMEISAPNVESICLSGDLYRKCLLINLSSLLHATLDFNLRRDQDCDHKQARLLQVLEGLEHVRNLKLGEWCIKVLAIREKKGLSFRSLKCKYLTLKTSFKQEDIPGILLLLKCSPALESLTLNITRPGFEEFFYESKVEHIADFCNIYGERNLDSQVDGINCLQFNLRTINITRFADQSLVLPFIRCMLKEARVLKNMELRYNYVYPSLPLHAFFNVVARELSYMPKSSDTVVVKLHNSYGKVTLINS